MRAIARVTLASIVAFAAGASVANAQGASDFYKGKTVAIYVGFAPGGGADLWARFIARHIGKYIPGEPNVVVQNMPGAGGFVAVNHVYNVAP